MKCLECAFEMNSESYNIQKGICIRCNKLIQKTKQQTVKDIIDLLLKNGQVRATVIISKKYGVEK